MQTGIVDVTDIPAGDNSPFSINIYGIKDVDHYTLFAAGTPNF